MDLWGATCFGTAWTCEQSVASGKVGRVKDHASGKGNYPVSGSVQPEIRAISVDILTDAFGVD